MGIILSIIVVAILLYWIFPFESLFFYLLHLYCKFKANKGFLGYVVVGILAFLLGISVTLMCDILHKRNKERNEGNDRTDR